MKLPQLKSSKFKLDKEYIHKSIGTNYSRKFFKRPKDRMSCVSLQSKENFNNNNINLNNF